MINFKPEVQELYDLVDKTDFNKYKLVATDDNYNYDVSLMFNWSKNWVFLFHNYKHDEIFFILTNNIKEYDNEEIEEINKYLTDYHFYLEEL